MNGRAESHRRRDAHRTSTAPAMYQPVVGLMMAALTGVVFYLIGRKRYKCPYCARVVKWSDERCPHCCDDMRSQHRVGPRLTSGGWRTAVDAQSARRCYFPARQDRPFTLTSERVGF